MILTTYREYKQTLSISKRIFNFDDYYTAFLQTQMLDLKKTVQNKFKEKEIRDEIFSIIDLKIKRISFFQFTVTLVNSSELFAHYLCKATVWAYIS